MERTEGSLICVELVGQYLSSDYTFTYFIVILKYKNILHTKTIFIL